MKKFIGSIFQLRKEEKVLEAVFKSSFLNLLARVLGYIRNFAIAVLLGFSYQTDAVFMALSLMGIFLIFADVFDSIGVPQLVKARLTSYEEFNRLSALFFTFTLIISFLLLFLALALIPLVLRIPAGFSSHALEATQISYLLLLPYLFFSFYFHHFGAILRSLRRFTAYFIGEFILSFFLLLTTLIGLFLYKDYKVLPLSYSISQTLATLYMFYIGRDYLHLTIFWNKTTKKIVSQFFQLVLLYGIFHLYILVDKAFASYLTEKTVSALQYGLLIAGALKGVLKFENIGVTSMAESKDLLKKLNFYLKHLIFLTIPASLFLIFFAPYIIRLFFGYGAFSKLDIELTATALRFYALSLPFMFIWPLLYRAYQIRERLFPVGVIAVLGVITNALANYYFVFVLEFSIAGICLGTFVAYFVICLAGYCYFVFSGKVS
ncbi:MAG: lipid II flippase MurJ [Desulfurococcaceae archaeon]